MQVQTISPQSPKSKINNNFKTLHNQSFKGGFDNTVIAVMDAIDRGGLFASFTMQDMLGTNLPRPITGLTRNSKEAHGKKNKTFALKEAIREFTTGPSMFVIPGTILFGTKRLIGKATNVPANSIHKLGSLFEKTAKPANLKNPKTIKKQYYVNAFKNMLTSSTNQSKQAINQKANEMANQLISLETLKHKPFMQKLKGTKTTQYFEDSMDKLVETFMNLRKSSIDDVGQNFYTATIKAADGEITMPVSNMIKNIMEYADDAVGKTTKFFKNNIPTDSKAISDFISSFNNKRICQRFGINILMSAAVIGFLACIPKLYNISKDDPALRGLDGAPPVASKGVKNQKEATEKC